MARVFKSRRAEDDLEAIWLFIAKDNIDAADQWLDVLLDKALSLAEHPGLGRARPELLQSHGPDLRSFPVKAYVLYYQPVDGGIMLVRVLHGARDLGAAWAGEA